MYPKRLILLLAASVLLPLLPDLATTQQIYKWTDASGQVHYGEKQPENAESVQTLDIARPPSAPANADSAAEIARIKALSEQMARERQASEQARQEQAIRNLEQENQRLQNDVLNQQLRQEQQRDDNDGIIVGYPPPYPDPYPPYPPKPYPPHPWPCQPWPDCHKPPPPPQPPAPPKPPHVKPHPPFKPAPVGIDPAPQAVFRGR